jgi:DNA-binding PadR family transcriptional regulator
MHPMHSGSVHDYAFRRHHGQAFQHGQGFGGPRGFGPGFGPRGFMPPGPQRKRRGDVRLAILSLLAEKPYNGYGVIKEIAERTGGTWTPSPGSVYPTLQQLVDEGLIETQGEGRKTEFQLTDAGRAFVAENEEELARVWVAPEAQAAGEAALGESTAKLMGVIHQFRFTATDAQREKAVAIIDDARKALYGVLAE